MQCATSYYLQATQVSKSYQNGANQLVILQNINLAIKAGESVAILGASGSGKSTLLTLLAGIDSPTTGDIYLNGLHVNALSEQARAILRGKCIGFVFQSFQLLPRLTALENVMLPLELQYKPFQVAKNRAQEGLALLGLEKRLDHYPQQLSGGEQQRVAIARAFVHEPEIIFADEMTGNLDNETGEQIADLVFKLNKERQTTLVLVTHDANLAARCARRLNLSKGILS